MRGRYAEKLRQALEGAVPAHPDVALRKAQTLCDLGGSKRLGVGQREDLAVVLVQPAECCSHGRPALVGDERGERIRGLRVSRGSSEASERATLPARRPASMLANVESGLKEKGRKGLRLLDAAGLHRFDRATDGFLGCVLGLGPVPQPPCREVEQPGSKLLDR